jgi:moderate conductance mechanosensitive channel
MICKLRTLSLVAFALFSIAWTGVLATSVDSAAQTAQPSATTSPPPEKVQELIKLLDDPDVRAWLTTKSSPPASAASEEAAVASQISGWEQAIRNRLISMRNAIPLIPSQAERAALRVESEVNDHGFATVFSVFAVLLAFGFGAEWLFKRAMRRVEERSAKLAAIRGAAPPIAVHLIAEIVPLLVFFLVSAGIFLAFEWPALIHLIILTFLVAFVAARAVITIARILLSPDVVATVEGDQASARLIPATDVEADFWYRRVTAFVGFFMFGWATSSLLPTLGFSVGATRLITYLLGIGLLVLAVEAVWRRPSGAVQDERLKVKNWLITAYLVVLWGLWVAGLNGVLWLGIYALLLPKVLNGAGRVAEAFAARLDEHGAPQSIRTVLIVRGARALVIALAVAWLAVILRMSPAVLAANETVVNRITRGMLHGVIVLLVADLLWHLAKASIDRKLALSAPDESISASEAARRGRMRTLLPIFRNILAVFLATVAVLMVLSGLGVEIGPLIAGAGIFGVAIGFGSQTLVKDVISGVFYMLDDAFRVGEYIESGSYKGTVESFSLRSVKLRHHRGPVFTVPFGSLGAVQNMSRDWVIDKFMIRVPFDTDVKKVKKLLKGIGAELKEDPELGPSIIETVKMKGVEQFGDFGMELSFAFMTKPGQQSVVRRRAYTMIRDAFVANGIDFAQPTVHVGGEEKGQAAAAASAANYQRQKAAQGLAEVQA